MRSRSEGPPHPTTQLGGDRSEARGRAQVGTGAGGTIAGGGPTDSRAAAAEGPASLPCQNSHNSTEYPCEFPPSARRTAFALQVNVEAMCQRHGLEKVGFLTLTFAEHILDSKQAQRRMNSLTTHVLRPRYGNTIRVIERQKSGRIHYHVLVAVGSDIRTGCDFDAFAKDDYRSAPAALRREWAFWRRTAKAYGFGRTELLPVMSTEAAIGRYVGKYISKHIEQREERDRGVRLVSYSGERIASTRFAWASKGAMQWRAKLGAFIHMLHDSGAIAEPTTEAMARRFGPRWAHYWRDNIATFPAGGQLGQEHEGHEPGGTRESQGVQAGVLPEVSAGEITAGEGHRSEVSIEASCQESRRSAGAVPRATDDQSAGAASEGAATKGPGGSGALTYDRAAR